ncbi:hypothetical protein [Kribbella sp. NPDC051770]|uniref:hypothetical protein n=1 Tax=Kribbella sp. NPDC051770 TaxID=3155413 RepID=UPI003413C5BC
MTRPWSITAGTGLLAALTVGYGVKSALTFTRGGTLGFVFLVAALGAAYSAVTLPRGHTVGHKCALLVGGLTFPYGLISLPVGLAFAAAGIAVVYLLSFPQGSRRWYTTHRSQSQADSDRLHVDF